MAITVTDKEVKITRIRPWRVNFSVGTDHFSIQECGEFGEEYLSLKCYESDEESDIYGTDSHKYIKVKDGIRHPGCYRHYDLDLDRIAKDFRFCF